MAEPHLWRDADLADTSDLAMKLRALAPDLLLVDLFWVPISRMNLAMPTWLLLRSVPPVWLVGPREARFDAGRFERILAMEPAPALERFEYLGPVVYWDEKRAVGCERIELSAATGTTAGEPIRLLMRAGQDSDATELDARAGELGGAWARMTLGDSNALFPVSHWLRSLQAGDEVICGAGFNAFWEAQILGYAQHVRWVPLPRKIDDQGWRASLARTQWGVPVGVENGADKLAEMVVRRLA
jgi:hypothetical protein